MAPTVFPAQAGIQFFRSPAWMPAGVYPERRRRAGMTKWVAFVAAYGAHVHLAHISPNLVSPKGEGISTIPERDINVSFRIATRHRQKNQRYPETIRSVPDFRNDKCRTR